VIIFNDQCRWYRALDDMLSRISNKMALEEEAMDHIQVQIAKHPFSDEGAVRWPYYASITYPNEPSRLVSNWALVVTALLLFLACGASHFLGHVHDYQSEDVLADD
jgi:hypothetical protein